MASSLTRTVFCLQDSRFAAHDVIAHTWTVFCLQDARFAAHDAITNRKLLWHGTNVAVVAAIMKSGLRIMPHSGGRVGKGIYFASENSKSAGYGEWRFNEPALLWHLREQFQRFYRV